MKRTKCIEGKNEDGHPGWFIRFPFDALFLNEDFKDNIDSRLRSWNSATKTWWVDEECGPVLKELFENWSQPIVKTRKDKPKKSNCSICNDTGLLPFIKNGKTIPNAFVYCECHDDDPPPHREVRPGDIDFPVSYGVYRGLCQEFGWPDPGSCEPPEQVSNPLGEEPSWNRRQWDVVQSLRGEVNHLHKEVIELSSKQKQKKDNL